MQGVRSSSLLGSIFEIPCTAMDLVFFDWSNLASETGRDAPNGGRAALFPIHKLVTLFFPAFFPSFSWLELCGVR